MGERLTWCKQTTLRAFDCVPAVARASRPLHRSINHQARHNTTEKNGRNPRLLWVSRSLERNRRLSLVLNLGLRHAVQLPVHTGIPQDGLHILAGFGEWN